MHGSHEMHTSRELVESDIEEEDPQERSIVSEIHESFNQHTDRLHTPLAEVKSLGLARLSLTDLFLALSIDHP